ncbi:hypothetical protein BVG79_00559 [Ketogulonicigenium robustum]|uniref:Uncharacterized protein n=1 Tax=Ketogulonicigenium robustum TaxID=92947 RepID=A0A1W6NXJ5_9RHOB|nr:hypothetical protein [Ketogulonicigenium robustum]ARO13911.1 hypothetical protein BVG79_00559 [Ketogulonicigenium robustum]
MTTRQIVTIAYGDLTVSVEGYDAPETIVAAVITSLKAGTRPDDGPLMPLRLSPEQRVDATAQADKAE